MNYKLLVRPVIAAVVSPLSLLIALPAEFVIYSAIFGYGGSQTPSDVIAFGVRIALVGLVFYVYPAMIIFGLPSYFILRALRLASIWSAALVGAISSFVVSLRLVAKLPSTWAGWEHFVMSGYDDYILRAIIGTTFWIIARPKGAAQNPTVPLPLAP